MPAAVGSPAARSVRVGPFLIGGVASWKLNDLDPQAWLADALARITATPASRIDDLLP